MKPPVNFMSFALLALAAGCSSDSVQSVPQQTSSSVAAGGPGTLPAASSAGTSAPASAPLQPSRSPAGAAGSGSTATAVTPATGAAGGAAPALPANGGSGGASGSASAAGSGGRAGAGGAAGAAAGSGGGSGRAGAGDGAGGAGGVAGGAGAAGGAGGASGAAAGSGGRAGAGGAAGGNAGAGGAKSGSTGPACGVSKLLPIPADPTERGPWPVGQKTVKFGRFSAVEVMYPAAPGSDKGKSVLKQDLREFLPTRERGRVPDAQASIVSADTYRDLPLDVEHGPYPVVILVHGTASFRLASFSTQAHWASRGFVVMAADHPNLFLADYLGRVGCNLDVPREDLSDDVDSELAMITNPSGDLAFLAGQVDASRVGLAGHSAGAVAVAGFSNKPGVQLIMPLAGVTPVRAAPALKSVLFLGGEADAVLSYKPPANGIGRTQFPGTQTEAYAASPGAPVSKRIVGVRGGGHLLPTDLCQKNARNQSDLQVAEANGVCGTALLNALGLADCGTVERTAGTEIVDYATTAALEETLMCQDRGPVFSQLKPRYSLVVDFRQGE